MLIQVTETELRRVLQISAIPSSSFENNPESNPGKKTIIKKKKKQKTPASCACFGLSQPPGLSAR